MLTALSPAGAWAQTTLASAGFETSLAPFTATSSAANKWVQGPAAGGSASSANAAFVSNTATAPFAYSYTGTNSTSHLFTDVTLPAGEAVLRVVFDWKANGDSFGNDYLRVFLAPTTFVPAAGTLPSGAGVVELSPKLFGLGTTPAYTPADYATLLTAGSSYRVIFTWRNDGATTVLPPAAVDNIVISSRAAAPLSGAYTIDKVAAASATNFQSFTAAFTALNSEGISGGTVFSVTDGQVFDEAPVTLTATGTSAANSIKFQKSGAGTNPVLRGTGGTSATSGVSDAVVTLNSSDFITFNGIDLTDNPTNTTAGTRMERGLYLNGGFDNNGCQNNTYKNGTITLNSANTNETNCIRSFAGGAAAFGGTNSNNQFLNVTAQNATKGYAFVGTSTTFPDENNLIDTESGGTSVIKTLSSASTSPVAGVDLSAQKNFQVKNTTFQDFTATSAGSASVFGINASTTGASFTAANNKFSNLASAAAGNFVAAIYHTAAITGETTTINGNQIVPISPATSSLSSSVVSVKLLGLFTSSGSANIYDNVINNIRQTTTGAGGVEITGITLNSGSATYNVYRNHLHTLTQATASGSFVTGILIGGGAAVNVHDNLLANLRYDGNNGTMGVRALNVTGGTAVNLYHNTVYLSGTAITVSPNSACLYLATASTTTVDYRNNIFFNSYAGTGGGTPRNVAFYKASGTVNNPIIATSTNNNLLYGASGLYAVATGAGTGAGASGLAAYRALLNSSDSGGREAQAVTESTTPFMSATDPHLNAASAQATQAESGAQNLSALPVTDIGLDYDKQARGPYPLAPVPSNGGGTAADIGADEGNFKPLDLTAPLITIVTPLPATTSTTAPTLTGVTITDASGVATTSGSGRPRLYYKLSTDPNTFNDNTSGTAGFKFVEADGAGTASPFSFTLNYGLLPTAPAIGTTIEYFVTAQDLASTPNVGLNAPGTFATAPGTVALVAANFPIGGTLRSFTIRESFGGTVNVGPGESITSLTAANGLFARLNAGILTGDLTVLITGDISIEDGVNELKPLTESGAGGYTIRIQPSAATERTISGNIASGIRLNGADRVTFDGRFNQTGTDKFLRFRNTNTAAPTFFLAQDAVNNTIRNATVEGAVTGGASAVVLLFTSAGTVNTVVGGVTGNDNFQLLNCDVRDLSVGVGQPGQGFYSSSSTGATNSDVTISGNNFYNWTSKGVVTANAASNYTISGNSFYNTGTATGQMTGIEYTASASGITGIVISDNFIGGNAPLAAGTLANSGSALIIGILLNGGSNTPAPSSTISGNVIRNFSLTGATASFRGIDIGGSTFTYAATGNTVANIASTGVSGTGVGSPTLVGIRTVATSSTSQAQTITGNTVSNLALANTTVNNAWVAGIVTGGSSAAGTIGRNRVFGLTSTSTQAGSGLGGIVLFNGSWNVANNQVALTNGANTNALTIYGLEDNSIPSATEVFNFNSVYVGGTGSGALKTYAYHRSVDANTTLRNNVLVNERTGGGGNFALGFSGTTLSNKFGSDYNNLFATTAATQAENNTTGLTFAAYKALTPARDANSKNTPVKFTDPALGNLNLDATTNCQLNNAGVAIAGVDGEYESAATSRQSTPDLGSDEFAPIVQTATLTTPGPVCGPTTASVTLTGNGGPFTVTYTDGTTPVTTTAPASPFTFSAAEGKTYTLTSVTDAYGCALTTSGSLTVNPTPTATFDAGNATQVCDGSGTTLTGTLAGLAPFTGQYTVNNGPAQTLSISGNTFSIATGNLTAAATYTITQLSGGGCDAASLPAAVTVTPGSTTTYTGAASGDGSNWFNAANWSACVPTSIIDAVIPAGLTNYPALTTAATATVRTLTLANGAFLSQSAGSLNVYGNLTSNTPAANVSLTGGTIAFLGATPAVTGLTNFYALTVNLSSAGSVLALGSNATVTNALTLTQGLLNTSSFTVTLASAATLTETDASYVEGLVAVPNRNLSTAAPESFSNIGLTLTPDAASAAFPGLTTVVRTTGTALTGVGSSVSIKRYFDIQSTVNTGLNVAMQFSYFDHERNGIAAANVALFKSVSALTGPWANQAPISIAGNTVTKTGITDFSIWTLGNRLAPLPVELTAFAATRQGADALLTWTTASEKNSSGFEVQVSADGRAFRELGFVAGAGSSSAPRSYTFTDRGPGKGGLRYYRLRQLDLDGTASFSPVRTLRFEAAAGTGLTAVPNPFADGFVLTANSNENQTAALTITDASGRVVRKRTVALTIGDNQLAVFNLQGLPAGLYIVQLALRGEVHHVKLMKQ